MGRWSEMEHESNPCGALGDGDSYSYTGGSTEPLKGLPTWVSPGKQRMILESELPTDARQFGDWPTVRTLVEPDTKPGYGWTELGKKLEARSGSPLMGFSETLPKKRGRERWFRLTWGEGWEFTTEEIK